MLQRRLPLLLIGWFALFSASQVVAEFDTPRDPYENFNRKVFACNRVIDRVLLRPYAKTYAKFVPLFLQSGIHHAFSNLREVGFTVNHLLQMNPRRATTSLARLFINTIFGLGGLFDVATRWHLPAHPTDFGITLRKWSKKRSTYLVIPILGSRSSHAFAALPIDTLLNVISWIPPPAVSYGLIAGDMVQKRAELLPSDSVINEAFDPYISVRDAYLQNREQLLNN